jgi:hypothetical protein
MSGIRDAYPGTRRAFPGAAHATPAARPLIPANGARMSDSAHVRLGGAGVMSGLRRT